MKRTKKRKTSRTTTSRTNGPAVPYIYHGTDRDGHEYDGRVVATSHKEAKRAARRHRGNVRFISIACFPAQ